MNSHTDRTRLRQLQYRIRARKGLVGCGEEFSAALHSCGKMAYAGTDRWGQEEARSWSGVMTVVCGADHIAALLEDGTLRVAGRCPVSEADLDMISCARAVATGRSNLAVLLGNGRTVVLGDNGSGQCHTHTWPSVQDVVCGVNFTAGVTRSGLVYVAGGSIALRHAVRSWQNVAGIFTDHEGKRLFAITEDGRLISPTPLPRAVRKWRNLVAVAAYRHAIWGVTSTGRLLSTDPLVCRLSAKKQYVACAVCESHAVALTRDGQVLAVGSNHFGQCATSHFGTLYASFEEFSQERRERSRALTDQERQYQRRLADAGRYRARLACGKRITVCINAEGRVLTTAEFAESRTWSRIRGVACGNAHVLAVGEDGTVHADGNNVDGCTDVTRWRNIKTVAAGKYHSLGLTEDGGVLFCGRNDCGQGDVSEWKDIRSITTTDSYTVGVTHRGAIRLAGTPPFDPAVLDETWMNPVQVIAAPTHLTCLYADGTVKTTDPKRMATDSWQGVRAIAAGRDVTLGLCYGGRVLATGSNENGQCETSTWKHVVEIGCGDGYTAGLTAEGNMLVACNRRRSNKGRDLPHQSEVSHWQGIMAFRCGPYHLTALHENGQILACGDDEDSQCTATSHFVIFRDVRQLYGYGQYSRHIEQEIQAHRIAHEPPPARKPACPAELTRAEAALYMRGRFAIGMAHTILLDEQGAVHTDGANDCGQRDLISFGQAIRVAAGPYRSAVILTDGRIVMAGRNSDGQSDAQTLNQALEGDVTLISDQDTWLQIACGHSHTVALRSDGRVFAVGANIDGRCDTARWRDVTDICCGIRHTVALKSDGTCLATGDNRYGQCDVEDWQNVIMIAAGEFHTAALLADGRVVSVGDSRKGQRDLEALTDVIAIDCLPEATLCVTADGHVIICGGSGESDEAVAALTDVVALATCEHRIAAITRDGEVTLIPS